MDIENRGSGTRVTVGHGGNLYDGPVHRIDGSAFASKTFRPTGPLTVGGQLNYTHKPSGREFARRERKGIVLLK